VTYIDPYHPESLPEARFPKHIRYAYQQEWRLVWEPISKDVRLFPVFVTLGDLRPYCDLYRFEGSQWQKE
jgi:hypothetical protein